MLSDERLRVVASELSAETRRNWRETYFRDNDRTLIDGTVHHARHKYVKHVEFFAQGREYAERAFMAANRVGKTTVGGFEGSYHATGDYPDWWVGHRFDGPTEAWVASDTSETTRDIVQLELLGRPHEWGTGMIPASALVGEPQMRRGVNDAVDQVFVRHKSGGTSTIGFKSYDQGRAKFQGTKKHWIWLDEEPPADVYDECMVRLMTTNGLMMLTFTPLKGLSEVALRFMPHLAPKVDDPLIKGFSPLVEG